MRAARAQHRPTIQNHPVAKRRATASTTRKRVSNLQIVKPRVRQTAAPRRRRAAAPAVQPNGLRVFGGLTLACALLGLVFVTALHWQRQALQLGQQEVELRSQIDVTAAERRQLEVERNRARSPHEAEQRSPGLSPLKLDERRTVYKPKTETHNGKAVLHSVTPPRH